MNAAEIEAGLVGQLRKLKPGDKPHMAEIRRTIGCTHAELADAVKRLRYSGKLLWDRLELAPSQREDEPANSAAVAAASPLPEEPPPATEAPDVGSGQGDGPDSVPLRGSGTRAHRAAVAQAAAPTSRPASPPVEPKCTSDGRALLARIETWCAETGTAESALGAKLFGHPGFVGLLRRRLTVTPEKRDAVLALLNSCPDGLPAPPPEEAAATEQAGAAAAGACVSTDVLRSEIQAYLDRTGTSKTMFGEKACGYGSFVAQLARSDSVRPETAARVRAFIAKHPDGFAARRPGKPPRRKAGAGALEDARARSAPPRHEPEVVSRSPHRDDSDEVRLADIAQRRPAPPAPERVLQRPQDPPAAPRRRIPLPADASAIETLQSALAETPIDLMKAVTRRHPALWQRVIALARSRGERHPSAALYAAIERGLDALEAEGAR